MRVKKVPLQDLELWPDEVICFTAYTDTRNPVQQRRTYVDGKKLKAENAELRDDLLLAERIIGQISHEGFELIDENEKLRELAVDMLWTMKHTHGWFKSDTHEMLMTDVRGSDGKPTNVDQSLTIDEGTYEQRMRELGIEVK